MANRLLDISIIREVFERFKIRNPNPNTELIAHNNYTFCIAVLLSAQATDKSVNKATHELFKIADSPEKMLKLGIDHLKDYIKSIGLFNNKAKNIMLLSRKIIEEHNSQIPNSRDALENLQGLGRKSANVIMNKLFGGDFIAVDTHVLRVSNRIGISKSKTPLSVESDLLQLVPKEFHKNASNWLVLYGRYTCQAKNPKCNECFLNDICEYAKLRK